MAIRCDEDCENCKFADCILDDDEIEAIVINEKDYKTPEERRNYAIKYYWEHREERKQYAKKYQKKYYEKHREEIIKIAKRRRELKKKGLI